MTCPKCSRADLLRYDLSVRSLSCPICGWLEYPDVPRRSGADNDAFIRSELRRLHEEIKTAGLLTERVEPKFCKVCGKQIVAVAGLCLDCRREHNTKIANAWKGAHPEQYKETLRKSNVKKSKARAIVREAAKDFL